MNLLFAPDPLRPGKRRLRSAWRIAGQITLLVFLSLLILFPLAALQIAGVQLGIDLPIAQQAAGFFAITASVFIARRVLDRRSIRSLGLALDSVMLLDLIVGFVIAASMMAAIFLIERWIGWLSISKFNWREPNAPVLMLAMLAVFIVVGWQEELLTRGYLLQNLAEGTNMGSAVLISSAFFSLGHLANPNVSAAAVLGLFLSGVFLAYAYLRTRRLWLPIGLHIGWNFFEGTVLGYPVSGLGGFHMIQQQVEGPALFTGGAFGPEAGLILLPALAIGAGLVWLWTRGRLTSSVRRPIPGLQ